MSKPKLELTKKVIYKVSYQALERFIKEVYPEMKNYSFVASQECGNDCSFTFNVGEKWLDDPDQWEKYKKGIIKTDYNNYTIINGLCADKHIKPGEYLVEVCW